MIKKFEKFGRGCERCGSDSNTTTTSTFNTQTICMACKEEEKRDPDYEAAAKAEMAAVRRGDYNFPGVFPDYVPISIR